MSKTHKFHFTSLLDFVSQAVNNKSHLADSDRASRRQEESWAGASWETARNLAINGDIDGAQRLSAKVLQTANDLMAHKPRLDPEYRLDEGQWIDVARYVKGEPECWGAMVELDPMPRRGVSLIVNVSVSGGIDSHMIDRAGVVLGSVILGLQAQGYAVTLYAAEKTQGYCNGDMLLTSMPVNQNGQPLDMARLSSVTRPWFLRRILFSFEETLGEKIVKEFGFHGNSGYGRVGHLTPADIIEIGGPGAIGLDMQSLVRDTAEYTIDYIKKQLNKGGK